MKKQKLIKRLLYAFLTVIISVVFLIGLSSNKIFIDIEYEDQIMVGEATKIDFSTKKGVSYYTPESIHVEIYNKYNKDANIEADLTAYATGKYALILTPNYTGEYIINIEVVDGKDTYIKTDSFTVQ